MSDLEPVKDAVQAYAYLILSQMFALGAFLSQSNKSRLFCFIMTFMWCVLFFSKVLST